MDYIYLLPKLSYAHNQLQYLGGNGPRENFLPAKTEKSTLSSCAIHETVKGLRSFLGAYMYKVLRRVNPNCSDILNPFENSIGGLQNSIDREITSTLPECPKHVVVKQNHYLANSVR